MFIKCGFENFLLEPAFEAEKTKISFKTLTTPDIRFLTQGPNVLKLSTNIYLQIPNLT